MENNNYHDNTGIYQEYFNNHKGPVYTALKQLINATKSNTLFPLIKQDRVVCEDTLTVDYNTIINPLFKDDINQVYLQLKEYNMSSYIDNLKLLLIMGCKDEPIKNIFNDIINLIIESEIN